MTSEDFESRGANLLNSAQETMQDYTSALHRQNWNMAVRRAQEAVEQLIKGIIYATGNKAEFGHGDKAAIQLRGMLETDGVKVTEHSTSSDVPTRINVSFADDAQSGHAVSLYGRQVHLLKMEGGTFQAVWEHTLPDQEMNLVIYHERKRGGYIIITDGPRLVLIFNELGGEFFYSDDLYNPVYLSKEAWDLMVEATKLLGKWRDPAFYHEKTFSEADAKEAGEKMKLVYSMVKQVMGGPRFDWEPSIP
ncbi:HEPN domain-containing protein [Phormidium tenue FACHB-886]|nr:HEPN domain-containing protein [Phormidium tenue FACHB-886]